MDKGRLWTSQIHLSNWCKQARVPVPAKQKARLLTVGICSEVKAYCKAPSKRVGEKPHIHCNLVYELGFFKRRRPKMPGLIIIL